MVYESNNNNSDRYVSRVGTFSCVVLPTPNGIFSESKEGTPCIALPLEVTEPGDQQGKRITWRGWLTAGAFDYTIRALSKAFAWDGDLEAIRDNPEFFSLSDCQIVTEAETYNGETRVKVKWLNSATVGGAKAMDSQKLNGILAGLGRKARAIAKEALAEDGVAPAPATLSAPRPSAHDRAKANGYAPEADLAEDDIPF